MVISCLDERLTEPDALIYVGIDREGVFPNAVQTGGTVLDSSSLDLEVHGFSVSLVFSLLSGLLLMLDVMVRQSFKRL